VAGTSVKFKQLLVITRSIVRRPLRYAYSKIRRIPAKLRTFIAFKLKPTFDRHNTFFNAHFTLLGLFAKSDKPINNEESSLIWDYVTGRLMLEASKQTKAMSIFFNAGHKGETFEMTAQLISRMTKNNIELLSPIFEILSELAIADGALCKQEELYLLRVMHIFRMELYDPSRYRDPYAVLGCHAGDSIEKIKKIYRRKVAEFHPDRMEMLGLPKEFMKFGLARFQEIQTAYEIIKTRKRIR
jgi:DnaJ like chaperone protein